MEEQELIENPAALLTLIQQAVQQLIEKRPDTAEQEAQLRAVAKAIEQLEKQKVPVPDSLRQMKMSLVDEISQQEQVDQQLKILGDGLVEVLDMIEEATGKPRQQEKVEKEKTPRQRRPKGSGTMTSMSDLRKFIIQALTELGGSAHCSKVLDRMQELLDGKLLSGDLLQIQGKGDELVWRNRSRWERQAMVNEGILRNNSQHGYWELNLDRPSDPEEKQTYTSI